MEKGRYRVVTIITKLPFTVTIRFLDSLKFSRRK